MEITSGTSLAWPSSKQGSLLKSKDGYISSFASFIYCTTAEEVGAVSWRISISSPVGLPPLRQPVWQKTHMRHYPVINLGHEDHCFFIYHTASSRLQSTGLP